MLFLFIQCVLCDKIFGEGGDIMANCAEIVLKSGNNIIVDFLQSVNFCNTEDDTPNVVREFKNFYLDEKFLTFVGKNTIVSLNSTSIDYVIFSGKFFE